MANVCIEESTMQAIGNAIREKTGNTASILPADMPAAIESIETGDNFYDIFWDNYQDNGTRSHYTYAFAGRGWDDDCFKPKYPLDTTITNAASMFSSCMYLGEIDYDLDFSNSTDCSYLFNSAISLHTIRSIKFNNSIAQSKNNYIFASCTALKNITIKGDIDFNISFSSCKNLTKASLTSIIDALVNHGPTGLNDNISRTLTLHANAKAQLTEEDIALITTTKGWTLA